MLCARLILNRDREIAKHAAVGGRGPVVVGSPEEVAEELIAWVEETDVDGFKLAYAVMPETFTRMLKMENRATFHPRGLGGSQAPRRNPPQAPM
jgi:hypothetical protein